MKNEPVLGTSTSVKTNGERDVFITSEQLVCALLGSDHVVLQGFGNPQQEVPFWMPVASVFSPEPDAPDLASKKVSHTMRRLLLLSALVAMVCLSSLAFLGGRMTAPFDTSKSPAPAGSAVAWTVKSVNDTGILVGVGNASLTIPIGAMLPSGEILRGVNARHQNYYTDTQVTAVKSKSND